MLPNLIITGFPKCGTTSLFTWLADHPQVAGSLVKETNYFVDPGTHSFVARSNFRDHGLVGYEAFFPMETAARIVVEATPQYAYQKSALSELPKLPSHPKLIFVVRSPADQILSLYTYYKNNFHFFAASISFSEFMRLVRQKDSRIRKNELLIDAANNCDYEQHLQRWQDAVGKERMLVFIFEDIKKDKRFFMSTLCSRLGIDPSFYDDYGFPLENYSYKVRSYRFHQLNIFIRERLPIAQRSSLWRGLRTLYRHLNTRPHDKTMSEEDQDVYRSLDEYWAPRYRRLVHRYGLFQGPPKNITADVSAHA